MDANPNRIGCSITDADGNIVGYAYFNNGFKPDANCNLRFTVCDFVGDADPNRDPEPLADLDTDFDWDTNATAERTSVTH